MRTRDMLKRFAAGCAVCLLSTACTTPLGPSNTPQPPPPSSTDAGALSAGSRPAAAPTHGPPAAASSSAAADPPFDVGWPGNAGAQSSDVDGEAHLRGDAGTFFQRGTASYYGKGFHGRRTAAGDKFDMYGLTAAHPTLPLGSWILVRNLHNNKTVVVRVNDRGPYAKGRILDLSYAAAKKLHFVRQGHTRVEIRRLSRTEVASLGLDKHGDDDVPTSAAANAAPSDSPSMMAATQTAAP